MFGRRDRARIAELTERVRALEQRLGVEPDFTPSTLRRYWDADPRTWDEVTGYGRGRPGFTPRKYNDPPRKFGKTNRPEPRPYRFGGVNWGDPETPTIASKSYLKGREPRGE